MSFTIGEHNYRMLQLCHELKSLLHKSRRALKNAQRQQRQEIDGVDIRIRPELWWHAYHDVQRQIDKVLQQIEKSKT